MSCLPGGSVAGVPGAALATVGVALACFSQLSGPAVQRIEPRADLVIEHELTAGAADRYELSLAAGQFVDLVVTGAGAAAVSLVDSAGVERVRLGRDTTPDGAKRLCDVAEQSGTYVVIVAAGETAAAGRYRLRVSAVRPADDRDRSRAAALRAFAEGERLTLQRSGSGYRGAIAEYQRSAQQWHLAGDRAEEAMALFRLGYAYGATSQYPQAIDANLRSAALRHDLGDERSEGTALNNAGAEYYELADYPLALKYYSQALELRRAAGDANGEAYTLSGLGTVNQSTGDVDTALAQYQQAIALWRTAGNRAGEAIGLHNAGSAYRALGRFQEALDSYTRALDIRRAMTDGAGAASTLTQIGNLRVTLGKPDHALDAYREALRLRQPGVARRGEAHTLSAMGTALAERRDWTAALDHFAQAGEIFRAIDDRDGEAQVLLSTGRTWLKRDEPRRALDPLNRSYTLYEAIGGRRSMAFVDIEMAGAYARLGQADAALEHYRSALGVFEKVRDRNAELTTLVGLATLEQRLDRLTDARGHAGAAVGLLETLRSGIASEELRTSYLARRHDAYALYVDLEMQLEAREPGRGHLEAALSGSERARARGLLDLLAEASSSIIGGVDPALAARERALTRRLDQERDRLTQLLGGSADDKGVAAAERAADELAGSLRDVQQQIRFDSPQYAALTQPAGLAPADIQRLLDDDTLLLEYALGGDRSYLWAVTRDSVKGFMLPARGRIEEAARRCYDLLARGARRETQRQTARALESLSSLILGPVPPALWRTRVVVVADGALHYVPFAALPEPTGHAPLIARHQIAMLPSASTLEALRRTDRAPIDSSRTLAVFADPVLRQRDPRVAARAAVDRRPPPSGEREEPPAAETDALRAARESGLSTLGRLPFARAEADAIAALAPRAQILKALDFDASREAALAEISRYRLVHFATHALFNSRHPERSGILLSMVDRDGTAIDGFLRLQDIYNLRLNADLVVLSACRTALGRDIRGEGLVGLTRGFLYAGAPAVVASLWDVRDRSTAELMTRMYRAMFRDHLMPVAALRAAQTSMSRDPRWSAPAHWAGFTLQGDWQPRPRRAGQ